MKKVIIFCILLMVIGMISGFMVCQNTNNNLLNAYDSYNKATEDLLDSLDNQYNRVDAYYYASRAKLDSILWN